MASANEHQEFYITMKTINHIRVITGIYTTEPSDPAIKYTRIMFRPDDIPYLRITRLSSYNENEYTAGKRITLKYLHSIGEALDIHPELGSELAPCYKDAVEKGYFKETTIDSLRPFIYDCIRVIREPTTHIFTRIISFGGSSALLYEKVSQTDFVLDVPSDMGFFKEYPFKLWGLLLKRGLEAEDETGQPCITAFSADKEKLEHIDLSKLTYDNTLDKYVITEIVAIGWMNINKPDHKFYGVGNHQGCEGVVYTDNPEKYKNSEYIISENPVEMNIPYGDGLLNA